MYQQLVPRLHTLLSPSHTHTPSHAQSDTVADQPLTPPQRQSQQQQQGMMDQPALLGGSTTPANPLAAGGPMSDPEKHTKLLAMNLKMSIMLLIVPTRVECFGTVVEDMKQCLPPSTELTGTPSFLPSLPPSFLPSVPPSFLPHANLHVHIVIELLTLCFCIYMY